MLKENRNWGDFIRSKVSLRSYIERYETVTGDHAAHTISGHDSEKGECLHITGDVWHCFNCGGGGDVIAYEMSRDNSPDFVTACETIARTCGLTLPDLDSDLSEEERAARKERQKTASTVRELLNAAGDFYAKALTANAKSYLLGRGITAETIEELKIGYTPKSSDRRALVRHLLTKTSDPDLLIKTGLVKYDENEVLVDHYFDHYMFPYFKRGGQIVYFNGRYAGDYDKAAKYLKIKQTHIDDLAVDHVIWNAHEVFRPKKSTDPAKPILIVEGIIDAVLARQAIGTDYDVISPCTTRINESDIEKLADLLQYKPRVKVIFCNDSEVNGSGARGALDTARKLEDAVYPLHDEIVRQQLEEAARTRGDLNYEPDEKKIAKLTKARMPVLMIATLPRPPERDKVDVADYIQEGRIDDLQYWLKSAMTLWRYEGWLNDDPRRFFDRGARALTDGTFRPKYLADEMRLEQFYLYTGQTLHHYTNGVYVDQEHVIRKVIKEKLDKLWKVSRRDETLTFLADSCFVNTDDINSAKVINMQQGIVDITTMQERDHSPYIYSTMQFNASTVVMDFADRDDTEFDKFLRQIVHEDDVVRVYEMFGYCLHASAAMHKAFLLIGDGRNGKSTLLMVLTELLGQDNVCAVSLQELDDSRWGPARLFGKAANIYPDMPVTALKKSDVFKSVTSGDRIGGERKGRDHFEWSPTTTQVVSMNELPRNYDKTKGFYRRLALIKFPNSFEGDSERNQDELIAELTTQDELDKLASRAVFHYKAALMRGQFTESQSSQELMDDYQQSSEPALQFVLEALEHSDDETEALPVSQVFADYKMWMEVEHGSRKPLGKQQLSAFIQKHMRIGKAENRKLNGKTQRCYSGIRYLLDFNIETTDSDD